MNVLVLMATRNGKVWLSEQIETILSQVDVSVRLVVSDDMSTDGTRELLDDFSKRHVNINVLSNFESSGSAGANFRKLIRESDIGDAAYICFADQDDIWHKDKLMRAVKAINNSGAYGYSSAVRAVWTNGKVSVLKQSSNVTDMDCIFEGAGQGCTFVLNRDFYTRVKSFCITNADEVSGFHYHDWMVYLLCRAWGGRWYFDQAVSMDYRQHQNNEIGARGFSGLLKRLSFIRKGWYWAQVKKAANIYVVAKNSTTLNAHQKEMVSTESKRSGIDRLRMALLLLGKSRRKFEDRVVVAISCLLGYLY